MAENYYENLFRKEPQKPYVDLGPALPQNYGKTRIVLMAVDPWWLHTYWEVTPEDRENVLKIVGDGAREVLRVYNLSDGTHFDIDLIPGVKNWYINVNKPDGKFKVSIGFLDSNGNFYEIASSNEMITPPASVREGKVEEAVVTESERLILASIDRALADSSAFRELIREQLVSKIAQWQVLSSGHLASEGLAREYRERGEKKRGFFLEVGTRLILHGRTVPGASVKVMGKPVTLMPDGTFKLEFDLPDGEFVFPVEATDGFEAEKITIKVERESK